MFKFNVFEDTRLDYTQNNSLNNNFQISKETQALELFNDGKKPIEVAKELYIGTDFVFSIYRDFSV